MAICLIEDGIHSVRLEERIIKERVYFDENIWINVANMLSRYPEINQIPIFADDNNSIVCFAKDDPKLSGLMMKLYNLAKDEKIWKEVPSIHITGMNEVLFYLAKISEKKGVAVSVEGNLWEQLGMFTISREYLQGTLIAGEDGAWIDELYIRLETKEEKTVWNQDRWEKLCIDIKEKDQTVAFYAIPGATSELIYDAFLQKGIFPKEIVCQGQFNALYGHKVNDIHELSARICCLAGARDDVRVDMVLENIIREQRGSFEGIYLLSGVECILPDVMLNHMIYQSGKVVLIGEKRLCDLFEKHCTELNKVQVVYLENREQIPENANKYMQALWFYLDFPSEETANQFKEVSAGCMQEGIYLSRYFLNNYMFYEYGFKQNCFTKEETMKMKCLRQMQVLADECSVNQAKQNRRKHNILFTASHLSYLWDGIAPLYKYYMKKTDVECTVMFSSIWDILKVGDRNLKETAQNISEIRKSGGKVCFYKNWNSDRKFDACYNSLGFSEWYGNGKEVSKIVVSLQTTGYHTHYYIGNQKFEDMFSEHQRKESDYIVVSKFMAAWVVKREKKWRDKLLSFGYPRMDNLYESIQHCHVPTEWKECIAGKKVIYFTDFQSALFMYCLEYCKRDELVLIWRPHPYDYNSSWTRKRIEEWGNKENVIIDTNQSYSIAFKVSNALVTSFATSVQINYLFTDKPVLILDREFWKWGENGVDFQEEEWYKAAYVAHDERTCREFVDMIMDGRDDQREDKLPYRQFMQQGFDGRVCERIAEFIDQRLEEVTSKDWE